MTIKKYPKLRKGVRMSPLDLQLPETAYLIQLPHGKSIGVSTYVYQILSLMNGERSVPQIARVISRLQGRRISGREIVWIIENKFKPLGLLESEEYNASSLRTPIEVRPKRKRFTLTPDKLRIITGLLHYLFSWSVVVFLLPLVMVANGLMFQEYGFAILRVGFLEMTGLEYFWTLILICGCIVFHEIGHASACRHLGCVHGEMSVEISLPIPTFYVDVKDAWRLPRLRRAIVDLGGLWFQLLCIPILYLLYTLTASFTLIFGIFLLDLGVLWTMIPTHNSDGYWFLADILGLPGLGGRNYQRLLAADSTARKRTLAIVSLILLVGFLTVPVTWEAISIWPTVASDSLMKIMRNLTRVGLLDLLGSFVKLLAPTAIVAGLVLLNLRLVRSARVIIGWLRGSVARH